MRMLFTCRPTFGHIQPLMPLAKAALEAGHHVTFGAAAETLPALAAQGFATEIVGGPSDPGLRSILSGANAPPLEQHRLVAFTRCFAGSELTQRLSDLGPLIRALRPNVLVHEIAELAAPLAAAAAGIPLVTVGFGPLLDPAVADAAGNVAAPAWRERGLKPARWAGLYGGLYLDPCPPSLQVAESADLPIVQLMRTQSGGAGQAPEWVGRLKTPLVYVTLGTIFNKQRDVFQRCLAALEGLPVEVVVTVGEDNDPAALNASSGSVRVERFIPQDTLLPHCKLVISHAGAGTMLGSLAFGVPMVLLPQGADQLYNAQRCCAAGAALMLRPEQATIEAISAAVISLLDTSAFTERALAIAAEMARMPSPAQALERVEQFTLATN